MTTLSEALGQWVLDKLAGQGEDIETEAAEIFRARQEMAEM